MAGGAEILRHLHCQHPTGFYCFHEPWKKLVVAVQPVQCGVGVHNVGRASWLPVIKVGMLPIDPGLHICSSFQHAGRRVYSGDVGVGPALFQYPSDRARAAAKVIYGFGGIDLDAGYQVQGRP